MKPEKFDTIGRSVHDGTEVSSHRYRQCPLTRTNLLLPGLCIDLAESLADGDIGIGSAVVGSDRDVWLFSSRTPEHHIKLLTELIHASKQKPPPKTRPKFNHSR